MNRKTSVQRGMVGAYALLLLGMGVIIAGFSEEMSSWYGNWFSDRSYVFFLVTAFLLGAAFLLQPWNWARFVRLPSRRAILLGQAKELYRWATIAVGMWFLFAVGGGVALYGTPPAAATLFRIGASYLLSGFLMACWCWWTYRSSPQSSAWGWGGKSTWCSPGSCMRGSWGWLCWQGFGWPPYGIC